jgi:hypothetical protein
MKRYWYTHCPRCGLEGELFIARHPDNTRPCFVCDECSWYCYGPDDVSDYFKGQEGYKLRFQWLTAEEITEVGWMEYAVHVEES